MTFKEYFKSNFFRSRDLGSLPARVQDRLREREWANEVLVRIIQLGIVLMFSVLYSLAAKTGQEARFQPVPFVLLAYLGLSVFGLLWSMKAELPDWAVYFSILIDFGLLFSLMISFHVQYEQPASFILKAPTLLYVFIFIALRALRLEWKFVVAAGLTAAAGWSLIVLYVINIDPAETMITRSYVEYLTSNSVLIGAEVDKIISILAVTCILAFVVNASSNLLITAVTEQTAASDFSRFFDKRIADGIRESAELLEAGHGERRSLAIINVDIRDFSKLAEQTDPSDVMKLLSAYQARVVPILQKHGAVIDKFMGDGIMATIGLDSDDRSYWRSSIEAAEELLIESNAWKAMSFEDNTLADIRIGIGIAGGLVSFGTIGQGDRLEMTVIGSPVNKSAKFEKHNKVLHSDCIVSREVWENALKEGYEGKFAAEFINAQIEGIENPQDIVVLRI